MLVTFIESTKNGLNAMDKALAAGKLEQVADLAHKLLPPCRHIGAKNLYNHLKQIEEGIKNNLGINVLELLIQESRKDFESLTGILNEEIVKLN